MEADAVPTQTLDLFEAAVEHVNAHNYPSKQKLELYGLYKHITVGKCDIKKPGRLKFVAHNKYEAWNSCRDLTVAHAMNKYIKFLSDIDSTFKPADMLGKQTVVESQAVQELEAMPPPVPPTLHGRGFKSKLNIKLPKVKLFKDIQKQAGVDPVSEAPEDEEKLDLHEQLINFYNKVDVSRLRNGIGEVVEFGSKFGLKMLNMKLKAKYGLDMNDLADKETRRLEILKQHLSQRTAAVDVAKFTSLDKKHIPLLVENLDKFFVNYDPDVAVKGKRNAYFEFVQFADIRGLDALNKKLKNKYGRDLRDVKKLDEGFDDDKSGTPSHSPASVPEAMFASRKVSHGGSFSGSAPPAPLMKQSSAASKMTSNSKDSRDAWKDEPMESSKLLNRIELPSYVKPALLSFYSRYDQQRIRDGSMDKVYKWAKRNGLRNLNRELRRRYKQSLDDFVAESNKLKEELTRFYSAVDPPKLDTKFGRIFQWSIKNGRRALNLKLQIKYGVDLMTYNLQGKRRFSETSIEF